MTNELTYEQETVRVVFGAYINDLKAYSSKPDRSTFKKLEEVRDKAIKALEQQHNLTNEELYQSFIKLEAENERLHDALESQRWIPVSERLPEDCEAYLVCTDGGYIATIVYDPKGLGWLISDNIIAWQTLPEPYEEV